MQFPFMWKNCTDAGVGFANLSHRLSLFFFVIFLSPTPKPHIPHSMQMNLPKSLIEIYV